MKKLSPWEIHKQRRKAMLASRRAYRRPYLLRGRRALLEYLLFTGKGTIDDVRDRVELPWIVDPKLFGAVPGELAKAGIIRRVGYAPTCRPVARGRPITVWGIGDAQAAARWLRDHPDQIPLNNNRQFPLSKTDQRTTPTAVAAGAGMEA